MPVLATPFKYNDALFCREINVRSKSVAFRVGNGLHRVCLFSCSFEVKSLIDFFIADEKNGAIE